MARGKNIFRRVGWGLISAGLLVFAFLGYQLFVTDLLNGRTQAAAQADLADELASRRIALPAPVSVPVIEPEPEPEIEPQVVTYQPEEAAHEGEPIGRIVVEAIELDEVMFAGVSSETLKKGPGHMLRTPVPGQPGNSVVSGHRTTYGRPFYDLDALEAGDLIEVETAIGVHVYSVRNSIVVGPDDVWVTDHRDGAWLTLTTCHPRFSAAERLVIQAELVDGPNIEFAILMREGDISLPEGIT